MAGRRGPPQAPAAEAQVVRLQPPKLISSAENLVRSSPFALLLALIAAAACQRSQVYAGPLARQADSARQSVADLACEESLFLRDSLERPLRSCQGMNGDTSTTIVTNRNGQVWLVARSWPVDSLSLRSTVEGLETKLNQVLGKAVPCQSDDDSFRNLLAWHDGGITVTVYEIHHRESLRVGLDQHAGPLDCPPA